jgi:hypothetical protein
MEKNLVGASPNLTHLISTLSKFFACVANFQDFQCRLLGPLLPGLF